MKLKLFTLSLIMIISNVSLINLESNTSKSVINLDNTRKKSNDTSIKSITINKDSITVGDNMTYETNDESISLNVVLNDKKATIDYDEAIDLKKGLNNVYLTVVSEDDTEVIYKIAVTRNADLSNNKNIEVKINDNVIEFKNNKAEVKLDGSEFNLTYTLEDDNAITSLDENLTLKDNTNYVINFSVIGEDLTIENYEISIISTKSATNDYSVAITAIVFVLLGAFGMKYYIKYRGKKIKVKIEE